MAAPTTTTVVEATVVEPGEMRGWCEVVGLGVKKLTKAYVVLQHGSIFTFKDDRYEDELQAAIQSLATWTLQPLEKKELKNSEFGIKVKNTAGKSAELILSCPNAATMAAWQDNVAFTIQCLSNTQFAVPLRVAFFKGGARNCPYVVRRLFEYLEESKVLDMNGVFRVSASQSEVQKLREAFNSGDMGAVESTLAAVTDHNVASHTIKLFFRELPDPLLTYERFRAFLDCGTNVAKLNEVVRTLPKEHLYTLQFLIKFLTRIAALSEVNMMTPHNLAIVFGPTILSSREAVAAFTQQSDAEKINEVCETMIIEYGQIFPDIEQAATAEAEHYREHPPSVLVRGAPPPAPILKDAPLTPVVTSHATTGLTPRTLPKPLPTPGASSSSTPSSAATAGPMGSGMKNELLAKLNSRASVAPRVIQPVNPTSSSASTGAPQPPLMLERPILKAVPPKPLPTASEQAPVIERPVLKSVPKPGSADAASAATSAGLLSPKGATIVNKLVLQPRQTGARLSLNQPLAPNPEMSGNTTTTTTTSGLMPPGMHMRKVSDTAAMPPKRTDSNFLKTPQLTTVPPPVSSSPHNEEQTAPPTTTTGIYATPPPPPPPTADEPPLYTPPPPPPEDDLTPAMATEPQEEQETEGNEKEELKKLRSMVMEQKTRIDQQEKTIAELQAKVRHLTELPPQQPPRLQRPGSRQMDPSAADVEARLTHFEQQLCAMQAMSDSMTNMQAQIQELQTNKHKHHHSSGSKSPRSKVPSAVEGRSDAPPSASSPPPPPPPPEDDDSN